LSGSNVRKDPVLHPHRAVGLLLLASCTQECYQDRRHVWARRQSPLQAESATALECEPASETLQVYATAIWPLLRSSPCCRSPQVVVGRVKGILSVRTESNLVRQHP
jgi:hypothetical protein